MKTFDIKPWEEVAVCKKCKKILVYAKEDTYTIYENYQWKVNVMCPCGNKITVEFVDV